MLARSVPRPGDSWGRRYPTRDLFAHAVGYSYTSIGRAGLERSHNDELTGQTDELTGILDSLLGKDDRGDALVTTLNARAQREAVAALQESGPQGRAGRARRPHRRRARDGVRTELRPEHDRRPAALRRAQPRHGERPARQPRDAERLPARLDDEGRHRGRRARHGPLPARLARERRERQADLRRPAQQLRQRGLRRRRSHVRADELDQHGLGGGRREARRPYHAALHGALRVLRRAAARLPGRADVGLRRAQARAARAGDRRLGRRRPRRHRPGRPLRHAAPDGQRRADDRQRRRPPGAALPRPHDRPRRPQGRGGRAGGGRAGRFT